MDIRAIFGKNLKDIHSEYQSKSHRFLTKGGYIRQLSAGIYCTLPITHKIMQKIEQIIREEMNMIDAQELLLPFVMPKEIWQESGRYQTIGKEMLRLKDRNEKDYVLGMTHEEAIVAMVRNEVSSYKEFPFCLYQFQTKFRDELRPRAGLIRTREFLMKDAYSFHTSQEDLESYYQRCYHAYEKVFARCGIKDLVIVQSDTGMMGGKVAHEFMLISESGEDTLVCCEGCDYRANIEVARLTYGESLTESAACSLCHGALVFKKGIELGNIFQLGHRYSHAMQLQYTDQFGYRQNPLMGCYGIGVGRLLAGIVEQYVCDDKMVWPESVCPYKYHIIALNTDQQIVRDQLQKICRILKAKNIDFVFDDRNENFKTKSSAADLIGAPYRLVLRKSHIELNQCQWINNQTSESRMLEVDELSELF